MKHLPNHPAKYSAPIIAVLFQQVGIEMHDWPNGRVLDPFAGTGLVHNLSTPAYPFTTVGVEIEPEWAAMDPRTMVGDATRLPFKDESFNVVATSPVYGNRMSDHHVAKDDSKRLTYTHTLGRQLHENNAGRMHFPGRDYKALHIKAWEEVHRVLFPECLFFLNVKNFIKRGAMVNVAGWHFPIIQEIGFNLKAVYKIPVRSMKFGENYDARLDSEYIILFCKTKKVSSEPVLFWNVQMDNLGVPKYSHEPAGFDDFLRTPGSHRDDY